MGKEDREMYNVVFRGKGDGLGNHEGIVTWTSYENKGDFAKRREETDNSDEIIAEGVTREEAKDLVRQVPIQTMLKAAIAESTIDSKIRDGLLEMHLRNISFAYLNQVSKMRSRN